MKGFTLVEVLVTIFAFCLVMGAATAFLLMFYRTHSFEWEQSIAANEARKGIETMVKEIREARPGDDGSYPIEKADDKEFIFFSDIDNDGDAERVRYFLGTVSSGSQTQECVSFSDGGSCAVSFSNFLTGTLKSAQVNVSVEGDLGASNEYADIYADGTSLNRLCQSGCSDCASAWQGTSIFDVFEFSGDNSILFTADSNFRVDNVCDWINPNHSIKAKFEFSWTEEIIGSEHQFKKGVIEPTGQPVQYPLDQESVSVLSSYVRNAPPIFKYYDKDGNELSELPARLQDTKLMKVYLVINVNPSRAPDDLELESYVQVRNLKEEQ